MAESESMDQVLVGCAREGCTVVEDGKCLEGVPLSECPHVEVDARDAGSANGEANPVSEDAPRSGEEPTAEKRSEYDDEEQGVSLYEGSSLSLSETRTITTRALARIVVLAGMAESGKTTLLACLSEKYQRGPYAGHIFAGSRTLPAFENRCHLARVRSNREEADTPRTLRGEGIKFVHLSLRKTDLSDAPQEMLLSDVSGEFFRAARDSSDDAKQLGFLRRTDQFALLIDGAKLVDPAQRATAQAEARGILRRLINEELLDASSFVDVLFTKWDLIRAANKSERKLAKEIISRIKEDFDSRFGQAVRRLRFFEIAARPEPESSVEHGHGIEGLFQSWIEDTPFLEEPSLSAEDRATGKREFLRFGS